LQAVLQNLGIRRNFCGLLAQTALSVGAEFLIARVWRDIAVQQRIREVRLDFDGYRKRN
jgi:hypothetical protein